MEFCHKPASICSAINTAIQTVASYTEPYYSQLPSTENISTAISDRPVSIALPLITALGIGFVTCFLCRSKFSKTQLSPPGQKAQDSTQDVVNKQFHPSQPSTQQLSTNDEWELVLHPDDREEATEDLEQEPIVDNKHTDEHRKFGDLTFLPDISAGSTLYPDTTRKYPPIPEFPLLQMEEDTIHPDVESLLVPLCREQEADVIASIRRDANLIWHFARLAPALNKCLLIERIELFKEDKPAFNALHVLSENPQFKVGACYLIGGILKNGELYDPKKPDVAHIPTRAELAQAAGFFRNWAKTEGAPYFRLVENDNLVKCFHSLQKTNKLIDPPKLEAGTTNNANTIRAWMLKNQWQLLEIRELDLSNQGLSFLPEGFLSQFKNVESLRLNNNSLTHIPSEVFTLTNLTTLLLGDNYIHTLSPAIKNLRKLKELNVRNNYVQVLPAELGDLNTLGLLNLSGNNFLYFPSFLCNLKKLSHLIFDRNPISVIPAVISSMSSLQVLELINSQITSLPEDLALPEKLWKLDLSDTPLANHTQKRGQLEITYGGKIYFEGQRYVARNKLGSSSSSSSSSKKKEKQSGSRPSASPAALAPFSMGRNGTSPREQASSLLEDPAEGLGPHEELGRLDLSDTPLAENAEKRRQLETTYGGRDAPRSSSSSSFSSPSPSKKKEKQSGSRPSASSAALVASDSPLRTTKEEEAPSAAASTSKASPAKKKKKKARI